MSTVSTPPPLPWRRRIVDVVLALLAHVAVGASWVLVAASVMGSLDVLRRMAMNSEFAWDTGRLPQPWMIPVGLVAALVAHLFFSWAMHRAGRGRPAWGAAVIAWCGVLLGVLLGAYLWTPALEVGARVGPAAGQSQPWGLLGWAAHHSRLVVPALVGAWTLFLLLFSRQSPLVVIARGAWRWWRRRPRGGRPGRAKLAS